MSRLALLLFSIIATAVTGSAIVIALTLGLDTLQPILVAAGLGLALSVPVTWIVARQVAAA